MDSILIDGHPITYQELGKDKGDTLVLLSGWAQDHRLFKTLAPCLAETHHVLIPNYRGHDDQQTLLRDFGAKDLVDDTAVFIQKMAHDQAHLVSTSHGCWINIDLCERLGIDDKTVVIDWLMQPHPGFFQQLQDGQDPDRYQLGRQSFFDEWVASTDNDDVINHIRTEMPWFKGEMWMRACREIETAYRTWGRPLDRMEAMSRRPTIMHIYSQPLSAEYRQFQNDYAAKHPWFRPHHIVGRTHFPTLESPQAVAAAILAFYGEDAKAKVA